MRTRGACLIHFSVDYSPGASIDEDSLAARCLWLCCGLWPHKVVELNVSDLQQREDHWAIVDLIGQASHLRTIPVPECVKKLVDHWLHSAGISSGRIFRRVLSRWPSPSGKLDECLTACTEAIGFRPRSSRTAFGSTFVSAA